MAPPPEMPHQSPQERPTSTAEQLEESRLVVQAVALPPKIELDERLCRRAGIPLELPPLL